MPTTLPTPAAPRRRYGLCRVAAMLCLYIVGRWLFAAAMWCADVAGGLDRRR